MVELLEIKTSTAFWNINGIILRFQRRKRFDDNITKQAIEMYISVLLNKEYLRDQTVLKNIIDVLSDTIVLRIGVIIFKQAFIEMFDYFSNLYVEQWAVSNKCFTTNKLTVFPVLEFMFNNRLSDREGCKTNLMKCIGSCCDEFSEVYEKAFRSYWSEKILKAICKNECLSDIREKIGATFVLNILYSLDKDVVLEYMRNIAKKFTDRREIICLKNFHKEMFGAGFSSYYEMDEIIRKTKQIVENEYKNQCVKFVADNSNHIKNSSDKWELFYINNNILCTHKIDFSEINRKSMRIEVKSYTKHRLRFLDEKRINIHNIIAAINILTELNPDVHYLSDVSEVDVRRMYMRLEQSYYSGEESRSVSNVMRMFSEMTVLYRYLMSEHRDRELKTPVPIINPFEEYKFHNAQDYKVRTEVIPDCVSEQIEKHLFEIDSKYALIYKIFAATGMRMKEVFLLEHDCMEKSKYDEFTVLKYKQYKTIKAKRKRGLPDYHQILISNELADEINKQISETEQLRQRADVPYIFIRERTCGGAGVLNSGNYVKIINRIIKRHNICDESGALWQYTSKQQRKTVAVTLIENGATIDELAYWLGHISRSTASNYYAEVRKSRLAELNTEFFRKKFELLLSEEQLSRYNEEERKLLYVDFRLEQRRVEFGYCLRKMADGECDKRNSLINCANCKNLCTGKKYLSYWRELYDKQKNTVNALEETYKSANIKDYYDFKEYKQAKRICEAYENVISAIEEGEHL